MALILGLASALTYGAADFLGGLATRTTKVLTVVFVSQVIGSVLLLLLLPFFRDAQLTAGAMWWGAASGLAGAAGITLFYQGLALGKMSAVAPITAVEAASVPVLFGLAMGERPSALALAGVVLALVAVALVSLSADPEAETRDRGDTRPGRWTDTGIAHALAAGFAFGAFFILLDRAGDDTGLWPLVGARISSVLSIGMALIVASGWSPPQRGSWRTIAGAGALDVAANVFYLLATREGLLSIVAVLTSMYPATTVLLARVTLGERFRPAQSVGLLVALVGVVAIALG